MRLVSAFKVEEDLQRTWREERERGAKTIGFWMGLNPCSLGTKYDVNCRKAEWQLARLIFKCYHMKARKKMFVKMNFNPHLDLGGMGCNHGSK